MGLFLAILVVLITVVFVFGLQGLIIWGIGSFVCWAFQIPFEFTFAHGLAIALVLSLLESVFTIKIKGGNN